LSTTQWIAAALVILGIWLYRQRRNS